MAHLHQQSAERYSQRTEAQGGTLTGDGNLSDSDVASTASDPVTPDNAGKRRLVYQPALTTARPDVGDTTLALDQLNEAKHLFLDLLGWGVPPHYFIEYGVQHQLVYTVFKELNLTMPYNIKFPGQSVLKYIFGSSMLILLGQDAALNSSDSFHQGVCCL